MNFFNNDKICNLNKISNELDLLYIDVLSIVDRLYQLIFLRKSIRTMMINFSISVSSVRNHTNIKI
jgi:hypothetical protein